MFGWMNKDNIIVFVCSDVCYILVMYFNKMTVLFLSLRLMVSQIMMTNDDN